MNHSNTAQKLRKAAAFRIAMLSISFCLSTPIAIAQTYPVVFDSTCYEFAGLPEVVDSLSCQLFAVSLELFESSETYTLRWKAGGCTTFSQSGFEINNTYVLESDSTSGFHLGMDYGQIYTWDEWLALPGAQGYRQDCSVDGNPHESWGYTLLETGEMHGFGEFEGWVLELSHQPANGYYGGQIGVSASVFPGELGFTSWFYFNGAQGDTEFLGSAIIESLLFPVNLGCMYTNASNYDVAATVDDGSCIYPGCTDPSAANYSSLATEDDGSCVTCSDLAVCPEDINGDGVVSILDLLSVLAEFGSEMEETISGCTDPEAINYNPDANVNDGTCTFGPPVFDCGTESVTFDGYEYSTVQIGSQCWFAENLRTTTYANGDEILTGLSSSEWISTQFGAQTFNSADPGYLEQYGRLYNWNAVNDTRKLCPVNWHVPSHGEWMALELELGMTPDEVAVGGGPYERGEPFGDLLKASASDIVPWDGNNETGFSATEGGQITSIGEFDSYGGYFWGHSNSHDVDNMGAARLLFSFDSGIGSFFMQPESGLSVRCVYNGASFAETLAPISLDTASAVLAGLVETDGGMGVLSAGIEWSATPDLSESDTIFVDLDEVELGTDGLFELELTGLTPGLTYYYTAFVTNPMGNSFGDTLSFTLPTPPSSCQDELTYNGFSYSIVQIGSQCWFAENLRTTTYANGDSIPANLSNADWSSITSGAMAVFDEDELPCSSNCSVAENLETYGRLYNGYAVNDERGLCPSGWHVPSDEEWIALEMGMGMLETEAYSEGWRGTDEGSQLKSSPLDNPSWNGTNAFAFSGLPGGYRHAKNGDFYYIGNDGMWWSSTFHGESFLWMRGISQSSEKIERIDTKHLRSGLSVRCVLGDVVAGCTDHECINFNPLAQFDDGSCECILPPNNNIDEAAPLICGESVEGSLLYATDDDGFLDSMAATGPGVWYTFEPDSSVFAMVQLCPTDTIAHYDRLTESGIEVFTYDSSSVQINPVDVNLFDCGFDFLDAYWQVDSAVTYYIHISPLEVDNYPGDFIVNATCFDSDVSGCSDPEACNYDETSIVCIGEDCGCTYDCYGCTDSEACNFNENATKAWNEMCRWASDFEIGACPYSTLQVTSLVTSNFSDVPEGVAQGDTVVFSCEIDWGSFAMDSLNNWEESISWSASDAFFYIIDEGWVWELDSMLQYEVAYSSGFVEQGDIDKVVVMSEFQADIHPFWFVYSFDEGFPIDWDTDFHLDQNFKIIFMNGNDEVFEMRNWSFSNHDDIFMCGSIEDLIFSFENTHFNYTYYESISGGWDTYHYDHPNEDDFAVVELNPTDACNTACVPVHVEGHTYDVVEIGDQCWFAENLRTEYYANGDSIPANLSSAEWSSTTSGATAVYGEETASCEDNCDTVLNLEEFGRLYNWYAVNDSRNLCPNGWHVPTDGEWMTLEIELGLDPTQANEIDDRGAPVGKMLKASSNGIFAWDGYDDADSLNSGFSALPGGFRSFYGDFNQLGSSAYFWTSTPDESFTFALSATPNGIGTPYMDSSPNYSIAWNRGLTSADDNVYRNSYYDNEQGFSVRCLKNGPPLVSTSFMTSDTTQNVTLVGEVVESGGDSILSTGFIWGMSPELNASDFLIGSSVYMGGFEANLTGLEPGLDYYFSAFATSASGTSYGDTVAFKVMNCSPIDFGGHTYSVLQIGGQCWFKENLRTAVYANGDSIPANLDADSWSLTPHGATSVYGEGGSSCTQGCDESANLDAYGRLYNWPAVDDVRGLCPIGWHVPTDEEWMTLEMELELTSELANNLGWRGNSVGNQLKSSPQYDIPWDGFDNTNPLSTGFSALPGGYRGYNGWFFNGGYWASFWSASELEGEAWIRDFFSGASGVYRDRTELGGGRYVRCLQDDEVLGCTDPAADNFDSAANTDDGTCDLTTCQGNSTVNYGGHDYDLVAIGSQCWFAENLRTTSYVNGDTISANLSDSQWSTTSSGATTIYGEGSSEVHDGSDDEVSNLEAYGRLYNGYAVTDSRGLCPIGWHIPTDGEWMMLEMELGMSTAEANSTGWRGTNQAKRLKVSPQNNPSWNGYNTYDSLQSGFSAVPSGFRFEDGLFTSMGSVSIFWSSSMDEGNLWLRTIASSTDAIERFSGSEYNQNGFPVRCVLDFESAVEGCMDPGYFEYNPDANTYDGSCSTLIVQGCTDSDYVEYNPVANTDDGSCATLAIPGCTDSAADNYNPLANFDNGMCSTACNGQATVTFDGYDYDLIAIGTQCWFAENLRTTTYANGDAIPTNASSSDWDNATYYGVSAVYGDGSATVCYGPCNEDWNLEVYGRLYNWMAVYSSQGLCPSGWHVPSDSEWMTLEIELGMSSSEANSYGQRGTDQGVQMKSSSSDFPTWNGTNTSGFSALPGGERDTYYGIFVNGGFDCYWWSSSSSNSSNGVSYAWMRRVSQQSNGVFRGDRDRLNGYSVRCLMDE